MGTYPFLLELSTFANGADTGKLECSVPCLQFLYATLGIDAVGCTVLLQRLASAALALYI